jgi:small subunit ribosomal protein S6
MTLPAPTYDLVLLLDPQVEPDARAKIVADSRGAVEAQGELLRHDEWGERALTYPIEKKTSAEYHLLQFHAGSPELLSGLDRTLRITDGVLRFRIVKLAPGVPDAPDMRSGAAAARPAAEVPEHSEPAPVSTEASEPEAAEVEQAPEAPVAEPA